jgi:hypothetical protein
MSLRFLVKKEIGHEERRLCIYDPKIAKMDLYEIMQYGVFCLECNNEIRKIITIEQMQSVRNVIGKISDITHSSNPSETYNKFLSQVITQERNYNQVFNKAIKLISQSRTLEAFDIISIIIEEQYPSKYPDLIILYGRLNRVIHNERLGVLQHEEKEIEINKINIYLMQLINELLKR